MPLWPFAPHRRAWPLTPRQQRGAGLVEATVVWPLFFFVVLLIVQAGLVFHARSSVNYALHEAARAGTVGHARIETINAAFQRAMLPYHGGGRSVDELRQSATRAAADLTAAAVRIEILSPTQESFDDYASPRAQQALQADEPVIPNVALDVLRCPRDRPGCNHDPARNRSGQTLADANLLKLRVTYGIPAAKQVPLAGRFYTWALARSGAVDDDAFARALVADGRIPVIGHTLMRMQSDAIRNTAMASSAGPGNGGNPRDPGMPPTRPLPSCPWWDPACQICPEGADSAACRPGPDGGGGSGHGSGGNGTGTGGPGGDCRGGGDFCPVCTPG